ncbi:MAG: AbrB/MazE/SpoVT family DNA-binding domain-containing protein [Lentisphaerae bacterium]|nr:AbrB/MazE/SpoVT family DNA-binding domain-containing protein [Lentisphaerota bacterium]
MTTATIGARYQVVIPAAERAKVGLRPHDKVAIEVVGDGIVIRLLDASRLRGLGRALRPSQDPVDYVRELREEWGRRP